SGACIGDRLPAALEAFAQILLEPHLPAAELANVKQLALQELRSIEDEPSSKVMVELSERFYPEPFGRSSLGTIDGVQAVTPEGLRNYFENTFVPDRAIIGVSGSFDFETIAKTVQDRFGGWRGSSGSLRIGERSRTSKTYHLQRDTAQMQIALAYPAASIDDDDYYVARVMTALLSGGMHGRLFIEVREKRGLVYSVRASHSAARGRGGIFAYAGTTLDNAETCLSVMLTELRGVATDISDEELARAKADIKSRLVIQSESSSIRASQLVNDWWSMGRVRSLEEIKQAVDAVSKEAIVRYLERFPVSPVTLVTLGKKPLELPQ
ncbi:MAG: insulinase family protein, partial [Bdellovibrionales bacterium]|nr:insulinase family protein [Bdellovibrionales bacterium]